MCIITAQDCQGLGASLHLQSTSLLALLPLAVSHGTLLLQHGQEFLICRQRSLSVDDILLCLCILLVGVRQLVSLGIDLRLSSRDLLLLRCFELIVCLLGIALV